MVTEFSRTLFLHVELRARQKQSSEIARLLYIYFFREPTREQSTLLPLGTHSGERTAIRHVATVASVVGEGSSSPNEGRSDGWSKYDGKKNDFWDEGLR